MVDPEVLMSQNPLLAKFAQLIVGSHYTGHIRSHFRLVTAQVLSTENTACLASEADTMTGAIGNNESHN